MIDIFLNQVRGRLRKSYGLHLGQEILPVATGCAVALCALAWGVAQFEKAYFVALGVVLFGLVGVAVSVLRVSWTDTTLARLVDDRLRTDDVVASSVTLRSAPEGPFTQAVHKKATEVVQQRTAQEVVRFQWKPVAWLVVVAGLAGSAFLVVNNGPGADARKVNRTNKAAIAKAAKLARLQASELLALDTSSAETAAIAKELTELAKQLDATSDPLEAAQLLQATAGSINPTPEAERLAAKAAARGLERSLETQPLPGANPSSSAADQLEQAAQSLDGVTDTAALSQQLSELADAQRAGNPELAASLDAAAQQLSSGNPADATAAQATLEKAAAQQRTAQQQVADAGTQQAASQRLQAQADELQSAASSTSGKDGASQTPSDPNATPPAQLGQPRQPGQREGQGQQGQGQDGGSGGGGKQAGSGSNASIGSPTGTIARTTEELNVPAMVPPSGDGQTVGSGSAVSPASASRLPLQEAVAASQKRASKALEQTDLEPAERDVVSDYFDSLTITPAKAKAQP